MLEFLRLQVRMGRLEASVLERYIAARQETGQSDAGSGEEEADG